MGPSRNLFLLPSSPLAALKNLLPTADVDFDPGQTPAEAALLANHELAAGRALHAHGLVPDAQQRTDLALEPAVDLPPGSGADEDEVFHGRLLGSSFDAIMSSARPQYNRA